MNGLSRHRWASWQLPTQRIANRFPGLRFLAIRKQQAGQLGYVETLANIRNRTFDGYSPSPDLLSEAGICS
jgi:hypothetical protein